MKYTAVSSSEWLYPDIHEYSTGNQSIICHAARGGYLTAQIQINGVGDVSPVSCKTTDGAAGFDIEFYEMVPVFVGDPPFDMPDALPNRKSAFCVYDCMKPLGENITGKNGVAALYISAYVPREYKPGVYKGGLEVSCFGETIAIPVEFTVHKAVLPEETLKVTTWYSGATMAKYHNVELDSDEYKRLNLLYHKMMRRMHMNMLWINTGFYIREKTVGENKYEFDFSRFEEHIKMALSLGFKYFQTASVGGRRNWQESTILVKSGELPCLSYEGYAYLSQYLGEFNKVLKRNGWTDMFYFGIADEPNEANAVEYRALCGIVRKLLPGIKLYDAMSHGPFYGSLDVYVPLSSEYESHRDEFELFRSGGDELWHYVCVAPQSEGYINRFMNYPLLATRYLFWGNYKYNLTGYLHWAFNHYQKDQDPFTNNWPEHWNAGNSCILPPGDSHIVYPGEGEPWLCMRLEAHRESAEEYEILKAISEIDKAAADELCGKCFRRFNDVENDAPTFDKVRIEMLETLGKIQERRGMECVAGV